MLLANTIVLSTINTRRRRMDMNLLYFFTENIDGKGHILVLL